MFPPWLNAPQTPWDVGTATIAVVSGVIAGIQAVVGPETLTPVGFVFGAISTVATGAAIGGWVVRGKLDKIDSRFDVLETRLQTIERWLHPRRPGDP